jgi:DNA-binding transcriptional MerR regulator
MMNEFNPEAAAQAQSQPGVFSFVERLHGRGFPKDEVKIYLDEENAFKRNELAAKAQIEKDPKIAKKIEEEIAQLDKIIARSRYIFELHGFPPERYDKLIEEAYEEFPAEYETYVNPFSGARDKTELPN